MNEKIRWDPDKENEILAERGLSFWLVVEAIEMGAYIADMKHPDENRQHQRIMLIRVNGYVCAVPYVEREGIMFLKTMYFSRKYNEIYGGPDGQEG
jgi:uncharacterized DUF497 family protein